MASSFIDLFTKWERKLISLGWIGEEEDRKDSPLMSEERWDRILRDTGFSGLDFSLPDTTDVITHQGTTMISRATTAVPQLSDNASIPALTQTQDSENIVLVNTNWNTVSELDGIKRYLSEHHKLGGEIREVANFCNLQTNGRICILLELGSSILRDMTESRLKVLKELFSQSKGILWVTKGANHLPTNPDLSLVSGLLRTLRIETGRPLVQLDLDPGSDLETSANAIAKVYKSRFENDDVESEFVERDGIILIPRHMEDDKTGIHIAARTGNSTPEMDTVPQAGRSLKLQIAQYGLLDTFYFDDDLRVADELPHDYIEIEVKANALNFRDVMTVSYVISTGLGYPLTQSVC